MRFGYLPWTMAERFGDAPALADGKVSLNFTEFDHRTEALAAQLAASGVGRGDVVAVMLPNQVELVVAVGAAWRLGAAVTPINPAFGQEEASYQITDASAKIVIAPEAAEGLGAPVLPVADIATIAHRTMPPAELAEDEIAMLIYTSGSTGKPKGVMLDHANCEAMSTIMADFCKLDAADHCMLILPLFHVNALFASVLAPLRVGGRTTIIGRFSASTFFEYVERLRPTYFSAVPTIYALLAALPEDVKPDTSSLRFVSCGAAPVTQELLDASKRRYGFRIIEGYGLTEATCASAIGPVDGVLKTGTVGPALPGVTIRIVGPDGQDMAPGERGEVVIGGPTVMRGYLDRPEATAETVIDGWLHTGDVGILDEDGYLSIVDRIKDMIIRGGENLYPKEIEKTIAGLDGVLEVAVVGRPDPVLGEVPVAYVSVYPGSPLTGDDVIEHCRERLTRIKVPHEVTIIEQLPKNPVGKIDKPALRRLTSGA
ncbi:AMP-binding protein [Saccharomonospora sp. NPDC046836]|uniref:class I adenylate-forming enzyme family protein n=1 Tax=Saccharomonospora sp. NPDC046836 TaxID=3156921 RepID=UPI0033E64BCE